MYVKRAYSLVNRYNFYFTFSRLLSHQVFFVIFFLLIFVIFLLRFYFKMSTSVLQKRKGRNFSDIWDTHMIKGEQRSRGHYSAICNYCKNSWKDGRPRILREHLANHCKRCPKEVSSYYAKIIGKKRQRRMNLKKMRKKLIYLIKNKSRHQFLTIINIKS